MYTGGMTAQPINLLPEERFEFSRLGRFLRWALTYGRYAVVLTELVVIAAFVSRIWFDRRLTDLRELRMQKAAVVDSYGEVRNRFEKAQKAFSLAGAVLAQQYHPAGRLEEIQNITPAGVEYQSVEISSRSAVLSGFASGAGAFSTLLTWLQDAKKETEVKNLSQSGERYPGFDFTLEIYESKSK